MEVQETQNTETADIQEVVEKAGGDGFTTFDELEAVESYQEREKQTKSAGKAEPKQEAKQQAESKSLGGKEQKAEKKDKETEKLQEKASKAEQVEQENPEPQVKTVKLKNGDAEIELRSDTVIPVKVDGQDVEMTFDEVVRRASGDVAIETRFNQLHQERQSFESDRDVIETFVKDVSVAAQEDPIKGFLKAVERAGLDPIQYEKDLYEAFHKRSAEWAALTEEQRENYILKQQNERFQSERAKQEENRNYQKQLEEFDGYVKGIQEKNNISNEEFAGAYDALVLLSREGQLTQQQITPELVSDYILDQRKIGDAREILKGISPELAEDSEAIDDLVEKMYEFPQLNSESFQEYAIKAHKVRKPAQKLSEKVRQGKPDQVEPKQTFNPDKEYISFDQL